MAVPATVAVIVTAAVFACFHFHVAAFVVVGQDAQFLLARNSSCVAVLYVQLPFHLQTD